MVSNRVRWIGFTLILLAPALALPDAVDAELSDLRAVQREGVGSSKARAAYDRLVREGPTVLSRILAAMDGADPVAANWLRLAFDTIAERERKSLDADALLTFAREAKRDGRPRRIALDLVESLRPGTKKKLLPEWLDDPEFRHDAIEHVLEKLQSDKTLPNEKRISNLRNVFLATRDLDQSRTVAARLKERGVIVSVAEHLGFLGDWFVIGPFDGQNKKGFTTTYPPEKHVDSKTTHPGKDGKELRWRRITVPEAHGGRYPILVDLRKPLGEALDAVAFAWTAFEVPAAREVELRGAADDNLTLWVNGEKVFSFEEYQNGVRHDRHRVKVKLRAGVNTILVKVCQAPFDADNTLTNWEFLLRICDATGKGLTFPLAGAMR